MNDYNENDLVLKLIDDFRVGRYASLITKSSHFAWSIPLQKHKQLKKIVCWNQHETFYMLIEFVENLRWWVDFSFFMIHLT